MIGQSRLPRRLALLTSAGIGLLGLLVVLLMTAILQYEQKEQWDNELQRIAPVIHALVEDLDLRSIDGDVLGARGGNFVFALIDRSGTVLMQAGAADFSAVPAKPLPDTFFDTESHRMYISRFTGGRAVVVGDALTERREGVREGLLLFLLTLLPVVLIGYLVVRWIVRVGLKPLDTLRRDIEARDRWQLDPIDVGAQPDELRGVTATMNGFMFRLAQALDAERQFASNAAHELRTPLTAALVQVQRLRKLQDGPVAPEITRAEAALKRMARLVERLLQLARADAGTGLSDAAIDVRDILDAVLGEHGSAFARITVEMPEAPVMARIDGDAFGIIASNLIDNALVHSEAGTPVHVMLDASGVLIVRNDCAAVPAPDLKALTKRFKRHDAKGGGLGLGLYISDTIVRQMGGTLVLQSPVAGSTRGVEARVRFPVVNA